MFSNKDNIASVRGLLDEVARYVELRYRTLRLDFVYKLAILLSALVLWVVLMVVFAVALLFLSYTLALALAPVLGGLPAACALVALLCLLFGLCLYWLRRPLVVRPLTNFIARLFLSSDKKNDNAPS